jgi:hypothetical protein
MQSGRWRWGDHLGNRQKGGIMLKCNLEYENVKWIFAGSNKFHSQDSVLIMMKL